MRMLPLSGESSASGAGKPSVGPVDEGDPNPAGASEPSLEFVLAPKRSDARRRFAYIGASVAAAVTIGYLSGSSAGLKGFFGDGVRTDSIDLTQGPPPSPEVKTDASDRKKIAQIINGMASLHAQIEQLRKSVNDLQASERSRAPEGVREESKEADKANTTLIARLEKLESRLAQLDRAALDGAPTASFPQPNRDPIVGPNDNNRTETKPVTTDQKSAGAMRLIGDYVLDHVDGGTAFIIRPDGFMDAVLPGDELPGAGRVTAIKRRGGGWVVTTTQGAVVQRP